MEEGGNFDSYLSFPEFMWKVIASNLSHSVKRRNPFCSYFFLGTKNFPSDAGSFL